MLQNLLSGVMSPPGASGGGSAPSSTSTPISTGPINAHQNATVGDTNIDIVGGLGSTALIIGLVLVVLFALWLVMR